MQDSRNASKYRQLDINLYVGLWAGPTEQQIAELKRHGMPVICEQNGYARQHLDEKTIVGWMHGDEPGNAQSLGNGKGYGPPTPPENIIQDYQKIRANDPSRPVLLNLGQGVAWDGWYGRGVRTGHPEEIFAGQKRVELRRRKPRLQSGDTIAIYATAPRCELVGLARVVGIRRSTPRSLWVSVRNDAGIDRQQYDRYFEGSENAIGIELEEPVRFKRPATLKELHFAWPGFHPPQGYRYLTADETVLIDRLRGRPAGAHQCCVSQGPRGQVA